MAYSNGYDWNMPPLLSNNDDTQTMKLYYVAFEKPCNFCKITVDHRDSDISTVHDTNSTIGLVMHDNYMNLSELSKYPLPLGLKLTLTPEMLPYTEQKTNATTKIQSTSCQQEIKKVEKLKAVHVPMYMLMIGFFKIEAKYPADLVSKFYYAKRKLVWEILRDGLKDKIEIQWRNITAIRAIIEDNLPGILEIELDKVPSFFREIEPKPGKHTVWTLSHDFTQGQASKYRRHYIQFPPGVLDQYYAKLLQCDNRLLELSQRPFPSSRAIYFDSHLDRRTTQLNFCHDDSENTFVADEAINNQMLQNPMMSSSWSQGSYYDTSLSMESLPSASCIQAQPSGHAWLNYELPGHINNMMIGGYHDQEIEFNTTQSIETSLVYNYNTNTSTQIDWSMLS